MEDYKLDSHKLIYHPATVAKWIRGGSVYPIEAEISPSGACNHGCVFCAVDYLGYKPVFLDKEIILRDIRQMSTRGLKSVICSGEGEPFLNKYMPDIVNGIKACGVDVAASTNGVLFSKDKIEACLGALTWIRYSIAGMEENTYDRIQRGRSGDLSRVKENLAEAVKVKKNKRLNTTIGVQCILLPDNMRQLPDMAKQLREIGVDYLTVKPYSQHLHSKNSFNIDYSEMLELEKEVKQYVTGHFAVYFRANAMKKMHQDKCYQQCHGLPFMTHIDAEGNVWPCVAHIGTQEFCYGNINENTFAEIWEGSKKAQMTEKLNSMDINQICREACRLDEINQYLDHLKYPDAHINYIYE